MDKKVSVFVFVDKPSYGSGFECTPNMHNMYIKILSAEDKCAIGLEDS